MRTRITIPFLALLLGLGAAACASTSGGVPEDAPDPMASHWEDARLLVENDHWLDVSVYVVRAGMRFRLGMVPSMNSESFKVPSGLLAGGADVRLLVDPIGSSRRYMTEPILVSPGQTVVWQVKNHLPLSSFVVW